jgi:predicted adenylyl cyclase CyaB
MPQNLELKAPLDSLAKGIQIAKRLGARDKGILHQTDIYYRVPQGRLKLRVINKTSSELIFYHRPNNQGSRYSDYIVLPVHDAGGTNHLCSSAFGEDVRIQKKRKLFIYKNARIHLDEVKGLGPFLEFEVLVLHGKIQAQNLLAKLILAFQIDMKKVISVSYSDMLRKKKKQK